MDIGPKRGRLVAGFVLFCVVLALAVGLTVINIIEGRIQILIALGVVIFPFFIAAFAMVLFRNPTTLLTLSPEGVRFHLPALGLIPWNEIASAGFMSVGVLRQRFLAVEPKTPVPSTNWLILNMVGIGRKRIAGRERIIYARKLLDRSDAEIEAEVARLQPRLSATPGPQ